MVTWPFRLMSTTAVLVFLTPESRCQSRSDWQYWTSADGLKESYSRKMSIGADGRLWVRHGAVNAMSVLDGYTVIQIPEARRGSEIDWNRMARIHTGVDGAAWTVENHALMSFNGTGWNTEALEGLGESRPSYGLLWLLTSLTLFENPPFYRPAASLSPTKNQAHFLTN